MDGAKISEFTGLPSRVSPDHNSFTTMATSCVETIPSPHTSACPTTATSSANKTSGDLVSSAASVSNASSNLIPVSILSSVAASISMTHQTILNTPTITLSSNALNCDTRTSSSHYSSKVCSSSTILPTMVQSTSTTSSGLCTSSLRSAPSITSVTLLSSSSGYASDPSSFNDQPSTTESAPQSNLSSAAFFQPTSTASGITLNPCDPKVSIQTSSPGGSAEVTATAVVSTPTVCSTPLLPSTMHVPRGAAVAAHLSNRSSQAVTANAAQRASIPNRGFQLATGNWSRPSNTIITCGSTSNSSSLVTSLATTTATISTSKFTRLPSSGPPGMGRPAASLTTSASIIRPTSLTRVISTSSIINSGSSTSSTTTPRSLPCGSISSSQGVQAVAVVAPSARAVLTQTRSPGSVRPPTLSTIGQPIRLSQTTLTSPQRPSAPYNLSSVQRPLQPLSMTGSGNIRARTTPNPRLSSQSMTTSQASINLQHHARGSMTSTNITTASSISSTVVHAPARPQSTPGLSSTVVRPPQCGSRPASTGPLPVSPSMPVASVRPVAAVHTTSTIRPAAIVRGGFTGSHSTTFIRSESGIGLRGVPSTGLEGKTGPSPTTRLQHPSQQPHYLHMVNAPTTQKVSSGGASGSSVIGGSVSIIGGRPSNSPAGGGAPSIAVRISSSPGGVGGVTTVQPTPGSLAQGTTGASIGGRLSSRPAELHTTLIVPGGGKGSSAAAASSAASAAAAVLPPGTTITPTGLPPPNLPRPDPPPAQTSVFLHKGPPGAVTGGSGQYGLNSQQHYCGDSKQGSLSTAGSGRISSSGGPAPSRRQGDVAPQQQATVGGSPAPKPTASPRPSILRKRHDLDNGSGSNKACKNLTSALSASGGRSSSPPSPKGTDSGGNSAASTGSATLSANSSPGLLIEEGESCEEPRPPPPVVASLPDGISPRKKPRKQQLTGNELQDAQHSSEEEDERPSRPSKRVKRDAEYEEDLDNSTWSGEAAPSRAPCFGGRSSRPSQPSRPTPHTSARLVSPRAALNARNPNSENVSHAKNNSHVMSSEAHLGHGSWGGKATASDTSTSSSNNAAGNTNVNSENEYVEKGSSRGGVKQEEGANEATKQSPQKMSLIKSYGKTWKTRINHFERHSEVHVKPERSKVATFSDGRKKKHTLQKLEGWKVVHVGGQVSDMVDVEKEVSSRLHDILDTLEAHNKSPRKLACSKDFEQICELIKANVQRSKIIHDQMDEAKSQMSKLIAHKSKVAAIMTKYSSKRQLRKKDKK